MKNRTFRKSMAAVLSVNPVTAECDAAVSRVMAMICGDSKSPIKCKTPTTVDSKVHKCSVRGPVTTSVWGDLIPNEITSIKMHQGKWCVRTTGMVTVAKGRQTNDVVLNPDLGYWHGLPEVPTRVIAEAVVSSLISRGFMFK